MIAWLAARDEASLLLSVLALDEVAAGWDTVAPGFVSDLSGRVGDASRSVTDLSGRVGDASRSVTDPSARVGDASRSVTDPSGRVTDKSGLTVDQSRFFIRQNGLISRQIGAVMLLALGRDSRLRVGA
jgi:hypothetical protein